MLVRGYFKDSSTKSITACSLLESKRDCSNKSAHVYPVIHNSGYTRILAS